jgi:putative transposase
MAHTYISQLVHVVFSTKSRRELLPGQDLEEVWSYLAGIAKRNGFKAVAVGGTRNHVHVLLSLPATVPLSRAVQLIKGGSSKWIHEKFGGDFAWQKAYGAFTIGVSQVEATVAYIKCQEAHHSTASFDAEFISFLKKHGIEYDERYVLG